MRNAPAFHLRNLAIPGARRRVSAAVLAGAVFCALLLAPGAARACGPLPTGTNYSDATYNNGLIFVNQIGGVTITVPGAADGTGIRLGHAQYGAGILVGVRNQNSALPIKITVGGSGPVQIYQTGNWNNGVWAHNRGILVERRSGTSGSTVDVDVKSGVTIGESHNWMKNRGIAVQASNLNRAGGAGNTCVRTEATIYAQGDAIHVDNVGSDGGVTVTNGGALATNNAGIYVNRPEGAGAVLVTNTGDINTGSWGVLAQASGSGAGGDLTLTNSGDIGLGTRTASTAIRATHAGSGGGGGITVTNSGALYARDYGIYARAENGNAARVFRVANNGAIGSAAVRVATGIWASHEGASGSLSVTNSGDVAASGHAILAQVTAGTEADIAVSVTGGAVSTTGDEAAVTAAQKGEGSATVSLSAGSLVSRRGAGVSASIDHADNAAGRIVVAQGAEIAARQGVYAGISRAAAMGETRAAAMQPAIGVAWTGRFSSGATAAVARNDDDRFTAISTGAALESFLTIETEKTLRYGAPAGVEAHVLGWTDLAEKVAEGDDPGAFADAAAVTALFNEEADEATRARAAAIFAQARAALTSREIALIPGLRNAIDSDGDGAFSDAEIQAHLSANDAATRNLLRNVLRMSLSEAEKAVLRAAAANTGLDAALDDEDAGFSEAYKTAVRAFLENFNPADIRVAVSEGSIDSRGDGVRAFFATPHSGNGRIDVTVAEGASVTGGMAGVFTANAGSGAGGIVNARVTVDGRAEGGSDAAVHLAGGGRLTVGARGEALAGSSGAAIRTSGSGPAEIVVQGYVKGGAGPAASPSPAAVHLAGGGSVMVGGTGRLEANGAQMAILSESGDLAVSVAGTVMGGIRSAGGALNLTTTDTSVITGTVHNPAGPVTVPGSIGRVLLSNGGTVTIPARGRLTGVGGEALRSEAGDLSVSVAGTVMGDIRSLGGGLTAMVSGRVDGGIEGLGEGEHTVTVSGDGVVTGVIRLAASDVTVHGTVGAVRFDSGGTLTVGPTGVITGASGPAVLNRRGDLAVTIHAAAGELLHQAAARVRGSIRGAHNGETIVTLVDAAGRALRPGAEGTPSALPSGPYDLGSSASGGGIVFAYAPRARVYEALPSFLLGMSALPTHEERMAAPRTAKGVWARAEGAQGDWKADSSASGVEYDASRYGFRVGTDVPLGADFLLGFSGRHASAKANVKEGGDLEATANGAGVSALWALGGGFYLDAQFETTWFEADMKSETRGELKKGARGFGWAGGVELGRHVDFGGLRFTPSARLTRASVEIDEFQDAVDAASMVSIEDGGRVTGSVGAGLEARSGAGRLFAGVAFEHDFSAETSVDVGGARLKTEGEASRVRARAGGAHAWGGGRFAISGTVDYAASGDSHEVSGGVSLRVQF